MPRKSKVELGKPALRCSWALALLFSGVAYAAPSSPSNIGREPNSAQTFDAGAEQNSSAARWSPPRDELAEKRQREKVRAWLLSVEGVTHAPLDLGFQAGLEAPFGLRLFGGYGWVPEAYSGFLTNLAGSASGDAQAKVMLNNADYRGHTVRFQVGIRPFRKLGLYGDVGYSRLNVDGALDLANSGVPALERLGGGYEAHTALDLWLFELGYQGEIKNSLVWALALGMVGTFNAKTTITSVDGAPGGPALDEVAARGDQALESYGFLPTLTLRLGFDLL
jgi:hypothetical protein